MTSSPSLPLGDTGLWINLRISVSEAGAPREWADECQVFVEQMRAHGLVVEVTATSPDDISAKLDELKLVLDNMNPTPSVRSELEAQLERAGQLNRFRRRWLPRS